MDLPPNEAPSKTFALVVAATKNRGIGANGTIPWRLPTDLKFFRDKTTIAPEGKRNAVIMGRLTYEAMPAKFRPLPKRLNVVITRNPNYREEAKIPPEVLIASSLEDSIQIVSKIEDVAEVFVIGGGLIYNEAVNHPNCQTVYYTKLDIDVPCTVFFPEIKPEIYELKEEGGVQTENQINFQFQVFERKN